MTTKSGSERLPVIIAGAGPCGLTAAVVLQRNSVPFVIVERATKEKLCSNVGSGYDLASTTIDILSNRLGLKEGVERHFRRYGALKWLDMDFQTLRTAKFTDVDFEDAASANRSEMQTLLLGVLLKEITTSEEDILRFGVEVTSYTETEDRVAVTLSNGTTVEGSALLGCDGIHSKVRRNMFSEEDDPLHFCNIVCWWGKTLVEPGSKLEEAVAKTQNKECQTFLWTLGSSSRPGSFMCAPVGKHILWAFNTEASEPPSRTSNDLTRRGGAVLDTSSKKELESLVADRGEFLRLLIQETPAEAITLAGLFDRTKLDFPYSIGRVALLGDAAHPQTPFMGQGVNMAITDAYVCATRLSKQESVTSALRSYDSDARRKGVNHVIQNARSYGDMCVSRSWFTSWAFQSAVKWLPLSWLLNDAITADKPNKDFVATLDRELGL